MPALDVAEAPPFAAYIMVTWSPQRPVALAGSRVTRWGFGRTSAWRNETQPPQGVPEHSGGAPPRAGVRSPTERRFAHGNQNGRFLVAGRLGAGGMGEVYAAHEIRS